MKYTDMENIVAQCAAACECEATYFKAKEEDGALVPELPELPAIIYIFPETSAFYADGVPYCSIVSVEMRAVWPSTYCTGSLQSAQRSK